VVLRAVGSSPIILPRASGTCRKFSFRDLPSLLNKTFGKETPVTATGRGLYR